MCGIFTVVNNTNKKYRINSHLSCIENRGPDDFGWVNWDEGSASYGKEDLTVSGELIQGHTRLSILDLSSLGWQPMKSPCGRYSLVFNGEIYNYVELKMELEELGVVFTTESDTEVLLKGLIQWGEELLPKLRGMFAFTFFDSRTRELLVARDPFGIKPLFYSKLNSGIAFSSEVQQLLLCEEVSSELDAQMTYEYLHTGATEHTSNTMFKDIKSFPPASFSKFSIDSDNLLEVKKYWEIDLRKSIQPTFDEAVIRVRELFLESIRLHMRSDVEVGAALSGGIDSSAIVCAMHHLNPKSRIHTFSYIADEENINEEKWVDIVNNHVNAIVHKIKVSKEELVEDLDDLIRTQGEPFSATNLYAQFRVFKEAKQEGIKVVLDGQGADEMLAGYLFYQGPVLANLIKSLKLKTAWTFFTASATNTSSTKKSLLKMVASELMPPGIMRLLRAVFLSNKRIGWLSSNWIRNKNVTKSLFYKRKDNSKLPLKSHLESSLCGLGIPKLLRYEDRNSMRWSVESRVPFLHIDFVEYLYSLPEEFLLSGNGTSKYVFREAMRGIVPDEILDRADKIGFATPEKLWLTKMDLWVKNILQSSSWIDIFEHKELEKEWERVVSGEVAFDFKCWRWINLICWIKANEK